MWFCYIYYLQLIYLNKKVGSPRGASLECVPENNAFLYKSVFQNPTVVCFSIKKTFKNLAVVCFFIVMCVLEPYNNRLVFAL